MFLCEVDSINMCWCIKMVELVIIVCGGLLLGVNIVVFGVVFKFEFDDVCDLFVFNVVG